MSDLKVQLVPRDLIYHEEKYVSGLVARIKEIECALDKAWNGINSIGGTCGEYDNFGKGINYAVEQALTIIEDLGGIDPLQRARDNGQFGVGA